MAGDLICNRLDVPVTLADGQATNLSNFCGQKLVIFFCPADAGGAVAEIGAYQALASAFEQSGAWVVGIADGAANALHANEEAAHVKLGIDPDGAAFRRLADSLPIEARPERQQGATFVIGRDGSIHHAWPFAGHAIQALKAARERP